MAIKIYIDQGHNPRDYNTGAEGNGFFEQDITYRIGKLLFEYLDGNRNFEAKLSRPDENVLLGTNNQSSLTARVNDANSWNADVFISLHTNAAYNSAANGAEALIYSKNSPVSPQLAEDILDEMCLITGLRNRGVLSRPGLYVLRKTNMPAVLVEMGFITNYSDAQLLVYSPNLFARGIYRGILKYYGLL